MVKFLVNKCEESDGDVDHFVVFHEVPVQMIVTNVNTMDDQKIYEKLLHLITSPSLTTAKILSNVLK